MSAKTYSMKKNPVFGSELTPIEGEIGTIVIPTDPEPEPEFEIIEEIDLNTEVNTALKEALTDSKALFNLYSKYTVEKNESGLALLKEKSTEENFQKAVDRYNLIQSANLIKTKIMSGDIDVLNLSDEDAGVLRKFKNLDLIEKLLSRHNSILSEITTLKTEYVEIQEELSILGITHAGSAKSSKKTGTTGEGNVSTTKGRKSDEKIYIKSLLEEGKYTEKEIYKLLDEKYPNYSVSSIESTLRNSKNIDYTHFKETIDGKLHKWVIRIDRKTKITSLEEKIID